MASWIKVNIDNVARGSLGLAACVGIFKGSMREFVSCFSSFLGVYWSLFTKLMDIILTIEHTKDDGYGHLWLEVDSILVCQAFTST